MADFLEALFEGGASGRGWRSVWAIAGAVLGAIAGGTLGYAGWDILGTLGGVASGAFLGWFIAVLLRGLGVFLVMFGVVLEAMFGFEWLKEAL